MKISALALLSLLLLFAMVETTQAQLINGNFETGDFTGWTEFNTVGGSTPYGQEAGGTALYQVVPFDTAGTGSPSYSAEFEVGEVSGVIGGGGLGQGAGIYQYVPLNAGQLNISLEIAALSPSNNGDAGTFELLLDGNVVASNPLGGIDYNQTIRSTLSYSGVISAGTHQIAIDIRRGGGTEYPDTPFEYLDNIVLSGTAVPEPAAALFMAVGLATVAFGIQRRQTLRPSPDAAADVEE